MHGGILPELLAPCTYRLAEWVKHFFTAPRVQSKAFTCINAGDALQMFMRLSQLADQYHYIVCDGLLHVQCQRARGAGLRSQPGGVHAQLWPLPSALEHAHGGATPCRCAGGCSQCCHLGHLQLQCTARRMQETLRHKLFAVAFPMGQRKCFSL